MHTFMHLNLPNIYSCIFQCPEKFVNKYSYCFHSCDHKDNFDVHFLNISPFAATKILHGTNCSCLNILKNIFFISWSFRYLVNTNTLYFVFIKVTIRIPFAYMDIPLLYFPVICFLLLDIKTIKNIRNLMVAIRACKMNYKIKLMLNGNIFISLIYSYKKMIRSFKLWFFKRLKCM